MPYLTPPGLAYSNQSSSNSDDSGSLQPIDTIHVQTSPSLESALDIMSLAESPVPGSGYVAPWEQAGVDAGPRWDQGAQTQASESLWDDYDAPSQEPVPVLCIAHGVICKKGICMEYDRQLKELAKAQRGPIDSGRGKGKRGERGGRGGELRPSVLRPVCTG
jgi:hypothetical protein